MNPTVAIIGSGAAGVSAAYRIRQAYPGATITVYEREDRVGGRSRQLDFEGTTVDAGAGSRAVIGDRMTELLRLVGRNPRAERPDHGAGLGLWNGSRFLLTTRSRRGTVAALIRHYGASSVVSTSSWARRINAKWDRIYPLQRRGAVFTTPAGLLAALDLAAAPQVSLRHELGRAGIKGDFIDLVGAVTRQQYTQDPGLNSLAGAVALAEFGFTAATPRQVSPGWPDLFGQALDHLGVELVLGAKVTRVESKDQALVEAGAEPKRTKRTLSKRVATTPAAESTASAAGSAHATPSQPLTVVTKEDRREYDAVIIAAPLELADIKVACNRRLVHTLPRGFQAVHVTLVAGDLARPYFGLADEALLPATIFAAASPKTPFAALAAVGVSAHGDPIYRILTAGRPLSEDTISRLFDQVRAVARHVWRGAYPQFTPGVAAPPFVLAPGVYYTAGLETYASSLELSAVAGYNTAGLALQQWPQVRPRTASRTQF